MAAARAAIRAEHGTQLGSMIFAERFEYHVNNDESEILWDAQGWIGGDLQKFWFKTEGEYATSGASF
jgi:copper resistance protein B